MSKVNSLAMEVARRCINTAQVLPQQVKNSILEEFDQKLKVSGYSRVQRRQITVNGLLYVARKLQESCQEGKHLHRSAEETSDTREKRKLLAKVNWDRRKKPS